MMSECKCSMVTSLVGDGCQTCNPQLVIDMLKDEISDLTEQRDELLAALKSIIDNDTYETEYDGRMYSICHSCGAQDGDPHSEACDYKLAKAIIAKVESQS